MLLTYGSGLDAFIQFVTVLALFCIVLVLTYVTTRYIANLQKLRQEGTNIAVTETCRIAPNKYVQIVKLGDRYVAVAVCRDSVTKLCELTEEELTIPSQPKDSTFSFAQILERAKQKRQKK